MKKLIKGLHKFQTEVFPRKKELFEGLTKGQKPEVLFISCSDSRINPNQVTSSEPGDLFILRNAGNIIPAYKKRGDNGGEAATIEFALYGLDLEHIIVCGHSHCGAIEAILNPVDVHKMPNLFSWIKKNIGPTLKLVKKNYKDLAKKELLQVLIQENVLRQIENLKAHPSVAKRLEQGKLTLHAWMYEFETGEIFSYDVATEQFKVLKK
jgi:carbonic anhydrase